MNRSRYLVVLFLALAPLRALAANTEPDGSTSPSAPPVDMLMREFANSPGLFARFHDEKQIALLTLPIVSDGTIHFAPQKGLARHTLKPTKQSVHLSGTTLTFWDGKKAESVSLKSSPALRAFADAFGMLLGADRAGLEKNFELVVYGDPKKTWRLRLVPKLADLGKILKEIDVRGDGVTVTTLTVREASGDASTSTFSEVNPKKVYTEAELNSIFKAPPGGL